MSHTHRPPLPDDSSAPSDRVPTTERVRPDRRHRAIVGVGVAFLVAAIGCGLVYVGLRTDGPGPPGPPATEDPARTPLLETAGPIGETSPGALLLHAEFVVADNGSYRTRLTQTGKVTAVSAGGITVSSADGFIRSYAVGPHTVVRTSHGDGAAAAIAVGETATVQADEAGGDAIATTVFHDTALDLRSDVARRPGAGVPVR